MHIAPSDKPVSLYSLDVILSVGYRVKSQRGTQFRIWATSTLRQHLLRGFTLHERQLTNSAAGTLAWLVAESAPAQQELMIRLVLNLLRDEIG